MSKSNAAVNLAGRKDGQEPSPLTSLRNWLDHLAAHDRLLIAKPGVALKHELAAISKAFDGKKAVVFPSPGGHAIPVVAGLVADRGWIADALGVPQDRLLAQFERCAQNPIPWHEVKEAPVHEVVHRDVDMIGILPIPTHNALDSGPYISAGLTITRNPRTGAQNVAICRAQIDGPNRLAVAVGNRDTLSFVSAAEEIGDALEVAFVIGVDPLTLLSSQVSMPTDQDELYVAGALHGRPLDVVKCLTKELRVPAEAEIVLEGRFIPKARTIEGPFGEFTQTYGRQKTDKYVVEIDAITHRKDPIFHTIVGGSSEHLLLGAVPREASFLALLQQSFPTVTSVHLSRGGCSRYHLNVQMRTTREGIAKNVILAAMSIHADNKQIVVVDEDIDITDPVSVEWAIATRFQADRDLVLVPNCFSAPADPSAPVANRSSPGLAAKFGLDATRKPVNADAMQFSRIRVPGEDDVDPNAVIAKIAASEWRSAVGR
jgi:2,5-furandicarboxylate decarboxylase 1